MTRNDILQNYTVGKDGLITSPGKFENEMLYAPFFYDAMLNGEGDTEYDGLDGPETSFKITAEDRKEFPELGRTKYVTIWESEQGFVFVIEYATEKEYRKCQLGVNQ